MSTILAAHVGGAAVALVAGTAALTFRKGSTRHRGAGGIFAICMLIAAISAMQLGYASGKTMDVFSGMLICYLVLTSWATLHRQNRHVEIGLILVGLATLGGYLWVEWEAARSGVRRPDVPAGAGYVFATIIALALMGDGVRIVKGSEACSHQIIRHLWRMCFALFMATVSFFLSRAHLFPAAIRDSGILYVFALAPILLMMFWWGRTRWCRTKVHSTRRGAVFSENAQVDSLQHRPRAC